MVTEFYHDDNCTVSLRCSYEHEVEKINEILLPAYQNYKLLKYNAEINHWFQVWDLTLVFTNAAVRNNYMDKIRGIHYER